MIKRILLLFTLIAGTRVHNMDSHHTLHHDSRTQVLCKKFTRYPEQLITRILCHFVQHDVLTENEYNALRGDFHTKFTNGARGAVHSLQNTTHPWLRTLQRQHGSIVTQDTNGSVRITPNWKNVLLFAFACSNQESHNNRANSCNCKSL
jgi:hypothetical protein